LRVPRTLLRTLIVGAGAVAILVPACAANADPSAGQVAAQIEQASNELEDVVEAYNGLNENLKAIQASVTDVAARVKTNQDQLNTMYGDVQLLAAASYRGHGGLGTLTAMLASGSSNGLLDQVTTVRYISRAQQRDINRYSAAKTQLDQEQKRYDDLLAQQTTQQHQLADRKTTIESNIRDLEALKRRLSTQAPATSTPTKPPSNTAPPAAPAGSGAGGKAASFAHSQLGKPYVWGADGPSSYDCSGLTMAAWASAGVSLPHNAAQQWNKIKHIGRGSLEPGDLVFYRSLGHVAIYIGSGNVIHAPSTGDVVKVSSVDMMTPYGFGRPG
jgi:cell wall-associated NlpC family hydrolase